MNEIIQTPAVELVPPAVKPEVVFTQEGIEGEDSAPLAE